LNFLSPRALRALGQQPSAPTQDPCCNRQGSERTRPARQAPTLLPKGASGRAVFRRLLPRPKCERMPVVLARFRRLSVCSWARPLPRARRATQQQRERVVSCSAVRGGAARGGLRELTCVFGLQRQPVRNHERSYSEAVPHQRWLGRYAAPFAATAPARSVAGSSPAHAGTRSAAARTANGGNEISTCRQRALWG
jgi:hypothetical protein